MKSTPRTRGARLAAASVLALVLSACGSDDPSDGAASAESGSSPVPSAPATSAVLAADQPFGSGCATLPPEGPGSVQGMGTAPVATAAAANPLLSTLVQAVRAASLADSFNGEQDITVLAPANPAFQALTPEGLNALLADTPQLTAVLTHHVIDGRLTPDRLAGTHTTLNNDEVTIESSGEGFAIEGTVTGTPAGVICGNVQTANATVYVIDQVLALPGG